MTTLPDLLYVAVFALAFPLWDYLVGWPAFRRQSQAYPARARMRLWTLAMGYAWTMVAVGTALWIANDRSWTSLGFSVPDGWRLWSAIALVLLLAAYHAYAAATLARSSNARASMRQQIGELTAVLPHTRTELYWFGGVSLTAGYCEEFMYRGYLVWVFSPWLGWWGAAALSVLFFAMAHAYQGRDGVLRTGMVGAAFTAGRGGLRLAMASGSTARAHRSRRRSHGLACASRRASARRRDGIRNADGDPIGVDRESNPVRAEPGIDHRHG